MRGCTSTLYMSTYIFDTDLKAVNIFVLNQEKIKPSPSSYESTDFRKVVGFFHHENWSFLYLQINQVKR